MLDREEKLSELKSKYPKEIKRIQKMALNQMSVTYVTFIYDKLKEASLPANMEQFMERDALVTALVISYGRLFTSSKGTTKLLRSDLPSGLHNTHNEIMELRHERYAHHGSHQTIQLEGEFRFVGEEIVFGQKLDWVVTVGAPPEWQPLFDWLNNHIILSIYDQLDHLSNISGVKWTWPLGVAPPWATSES